MRTSRCLPLAFLIVVAASLAPGASAEVTRTLRLEVPKGTERFAVENLAGSVRIAPGSGDTLVAVATVHAANEELLAAVRFERVEAGERPAFRVRYPYDEVRTFHYPALGGGSAPNWLALFGGSSTNTTYDDRQVRVSGSTGTLLYADVEIQVPRRAMDVAFRNAAGRIDAREVEGTLTFGTGSGRIAVERLRGEIKTASGSGDIDAKDVRGSYACATGSGDCTLRGFDGERVSCSTGSGDIRIEAATAAKISAETGSGDIHAIDADAGALSADTGSGDVEVVVRGSRLATLSADTGSGDVTVKLPPDASFEAMADQGSGEIDNRFADATAIVKRKEVVGYRRGDGHIRIEVDTGSGDLVLEPTN